MSHYIIIDEQTYTQEAWQEERDEQDRIRKFARPARDESLVTVRLDRQFLARLRMPRGEATGRKRQENITKAMKRVALGEYVTPQIQVVEYEQRLTEANEASITPEARDEEGNVVTPEDFTPATPERVDHVFTLRLRERDLAKTELTPEEFAQKNWKSILAKKVPHYESWSS